MEYRKIKLKAEPSLLGFGCMRFPEKDGNVDEKSVKAMFKKAIDGGVNYFDSAYVYHGGKSEEITARVLSEYPRESYYLATKLPTWAVNSIDDANRIFDEQLKRLNTDYIDFYLLHALDKGKWPNMTKLGILEWGDRLKKTGKIRNFGFSFHDSYSCFEEILTSRDWDFCQIQLNYMDIDDKQGGLKAYELCGARNVPVIVMEPVKGGSLSKLPPDLNRLFTNINPVSTTSSWAMRWVASLPNVAVVLSGMSNMAQVNDNLSVFGEFKPLSEQEKEVVEKVRGEMVKRVNNGCTGCNYCMPCPAGINIPQVFGVWNNYGIYENADAVKWDWNFVEKKPSECIECGKCEEHCPQKISIRRDLKTAGELAAKILAQ